MLSVSPGLWIGSAIVVPLLIVAAAPPGQGPGGTTPTVSVTTSGITSGYIVRFGGPVDHAFSRVEIMQDGRVVQTLPVRLDSAPNVLFARSRTLLPGTYDLHWIVKSTADDSISEGDSSFSVESPAHR
jgi:methionine-rich copper-binding protein CopC